MTGGEALLVRRLASLAVVVLLPGACIIAQPSGDVPRLPETRPTILHPSVVPSTSSIITRWPEFFKVPVELSNPTADFAYATFIDYNPLTGEGYLAGPTPISYDPQSLVTRVRNLDIAIAEPSELGRCHVVEVIVALRFRSSTDFKNIHTPDEPGGDSVSWIYNPSGDVNGCPSFDGGIEASIIDVGKGGAR